MVADDDANPDGGQANGIAPRQAGQAADPPEEEREARRGDEVSEESDVHGGEAMVEQHLDDGERAAQTTTTASSATWADAVDRLSATAESIRGVKRTGAGVL